MITEKHKIPNEYYKQQFDNFMKIDEYAKSLGLKIFDINAEFTYEGKPHIYYFKALNDYSEEYVNGLK